MKEQRFAAIGRNDGPPTVYWHRSPAAAAKSLDKLARSFASCYIVDHGVPLHKTPPGCPAVPRKQYTATAFKAAFLD